MVDKPEMKRVERYCGMVGDMWKAESCYVGSRMQFHTRCNGRRPVDQNIGTFVCRPMLTVFRNPILDGHIRSVIAVGKLCIIKLLKTLVSRTS